MIKESKNIKTIGVSFFATDEERSLFGKIIRLKRQSLGLSLRVLDERLGLAPGTVLKIERGLKKKLKYTTVEKLAKLLDLPIDSLETRDGQDELLRQLESELGSSVMSITDDEARTRIGQVLRLKRNILGMTIFSLSAKTQSIVPMQIHKIEVGRTKNLKYPILEELCKPLALPIEKLITKEGQIELLQKLEGEEISSTGITDDESRARICQILRLQRKSLGLTIPALGKEVSTLETYQIRDIEQGKLKNLRYITLKELCKPLNLPFEKLTTKEGQLELLGAIKEQGKQPNSTTLRHYVWTLDEGERARIGQIIKLRRKSLGLSHTTLAAKTQSITITRIRNIEYGIPQNLKYSILEELCKPLDLPVEKLTTKEGQIELLQRLETEKDSSVVPCIVDNEERARISQILQLKKALMGLTNAALKEKMPEVSLRQVIYYINGKSRVYLYPVLEDLCKPLDLPFEKLTTKEGQLELLGILKEQAELPKNPKLSPISKTYGLTDEVEKARVIRILKLKRKNLGLTQSALAAKPQSIPYERIRDYEAGKVKTLQMYILEKWCKPLGLPMEMLRDKELQEDILQQLESSQQSCLVTKNEEHSRVGQIIRLKRKTLGLTQGSLAKKIQSIEYQTICLYEAGKVKKMQPFILEEICRLLDLPTEMIGNQELQEDILLQLKSAPASKVYKPTDKEEQSRIGQIIRLKRNIIGQTQASLSAKTTGVSIGTIQNVETGRLQTFRYVMIEQLCGLLGLPIEMLGNKELQEEILRELEYFINQKITSDSKERETQQDNQETKNPRHKKWEIPIIRRLPGGLLKPTPDIIIGHEAVVDKNIMYGFIAPDDSMAKARILTGDIVLIEKLNSTPDLDGDIFLIQVEGKDAILRRCYISDTRKEIIVETGIRGDFAVYPENEITILGKAKEVKFTLHDSNWAAKRYSLRRIKTHMAETAYLR